MDGLAALALLAQFVLGLAAAIVLSASTRNARVETAADCFAIGAGGGLLLAMLSGIIAALF